jgi:hypothetical protein
VAIGLDEVNSKLKKAERAVSCDDGIPPMGKTLAMV